MPVRAATRQRPPAAFDSSASSLHPNREFPWPTALTPNASTSANSAKSFQPPNLIEIQINSYLDYLQKGVPEKQRKPQGLEAVFREVFPIQSYDERLVLEYVSYTLGEPKNSEIECIREGITYSVPLYVKLRLREEDFIKDEDIYMGEIPMVTERGSFIINGAERVVVSQLHRSPGHRLRGDAAPERQAPALLPHHSRPRHLARGAVRQQRPALRLPRPPPPPPEVPDHDAAAGDRLYSADVDILNLFYEIKDLKVAKALDMENVSTLVLVEDAIDAQKGVVLARAFEPLTKQIVRTFEKHDISAIRVIDTAVDEGAIIRALKKDPSRNEEEALKEIYKRLRPGEPPTTANAKALLKRLFFDPKRYDLGRVGRYKVNQKLGLKADLEQRILESADIVAATKYLVRLKRGEGVVDDIDHLGSRRVRTVGELLANQCRVGLSRTERLVRERMTMYDQSVDSITPQKLINPKALTTVIRDFFARSQLSQFMDQINPLAEVTHKRRLSALGPGGLNRERAGFEVRDVHPSHYGRICPIETPEGPNIGLINSLVDLRPRQRVRLHRDALPRREGRPRHRQDRVPHRRPGGGQDHRPGQRRDRRQGPFRRQGHRPKGRRIPRGRAPPRSTTWTCRPSRSFRSPPA